MKNDWRLREAIDYGIINISVANIRRLSVFQSELVNQTLLGTIVAILDKRDDFLYIHNRDGYRGWVSKHSLQVVDEATAENWQRADHVIVTANYGLVRAGRETDSEILSDLVPLVLLKKESRDATHTRVVLPDGRTGYVENRLLTDETKLGQLRPTKNDLIRTAKKFLGIPYLWGGTSSKGFDCSGFVQTVFRLCNIELPRDAGPMSREGADISADTPLAELQTGDLLFFGKSPDRIDHVALHIDEGLYIHARGRVRMNSLDREHPLYEDYLRHLYVKARRVYPFKD